MKHFSLLFGLVLIGYTQIHGQKTLEKTDAELDFLHGKVKQITCITFEAFMKSGQITQGNRTTAQGENYRKTYTEFGMELETFITLKGNKGPSLFTKCVYDSHQDQIETYVFDAKGNPWLSSKSKFNKNHNRIEYINYFGTKTRTTWKYDSKGNMIEESNFDSTGVLTMSETYQYDNYGNRIEAKSNFPNETLNTKTNWIYTYDSKGNILEEIYLLNDGKSAKHRRTFIYNDKNEVTERALYNADDKLELRITQVYDDNGNEIESKTYDGSGKLTYSGSSQFVYDSHGSWTKQILFSNGLPEKIFIRDIQYYD